MITSFTACGIGGLTEQAADAAIDSACRALRLPTLGSRFSEAADTARRQQLTYRGFLAEPLLAECEKRDRRRSERPSAPPASPARNGWTTTPPPMTTSS